MSITKNVNVPALRAEQGRRAGALAAMRKRGSRVANLWIFESPKNGRRLRIAGDVPFMHIVLLEGDVDVTTYRFVGDPFNLDGIKTDSTLPGYVLLTYRDGRQEWGHFTRKSATAGPKMDALRGAAATAGATFRVRTELDLRGQEVHFDNWLTLCAVITRARHISCHQEAKIFSEHVRGGGSCKVGELIGAPDVDPALMLAVVAKALQAGYISTNLTSRLFDFGSVITGAKS
jgi:hypothetical protein